MAGNHPANKDGPSLIAPWMQGPGSRATTSCCKDHQVSNLQWIPSHDLQTSSRVLLANNRIAVLLLQSRVARGFMLMTLSDDERDLRIVGGLSGSAQASTSFQGPRGRCAAPEESRRECGRKPRQAVVRIV